MKALVCGGRDYNDKKFLRETMDRLRKRYGIAHVIHGDARGADKMAGWWADDHGIEVTAYPANWDAHGRAAGPIRNKQMLEEGEPDLVIAFPGGRGTDNMIAQARKAGVEVIVVEEE